MQTIGTQWQLFWNGLTGLIGRILGDTKLLVAIVALAVYIVSALAPELKDKAEQYGQLIALLALVIGGLTIEGSVKAWTDRPKDAGQALETFKAYTTANPGGGQTINVTVPPATPASEVLPNG